MATSEEKKARAAEARRARYAADPEKYKAAVKRYRQANPDKVNATARRRYAEGGVAARKRRQLEKYGLSAEAFDAMWAAQGGTCPVCDVPFDPNAAPRAKGSAVIDHDHETGEVRGLLCHGCNLQVGYIEKNTRRAIRAVEYVLDRLGVTYEGVDTDPAAD